MNTPQKRILALLTVVLLLICSVPVKAISIFCPDEGLSHSWGAAEWYDQGQCGVIEGIRCCVRCGTMERVTKEREHNWGSWKVVQEATNCQSWDGLKERTCKNCGSVAQDEVTGDHDWNSWRTTREATCTQEGRRERKCAICGERESDTLDKKAHSYGAWVIVQEATDFQVGIRERKCSQCVRVQREEFYPEGTLKRGDKGEAVKKLQEALNEAGYDCGTVDGDYGKKTESAIKEFEKDRNMPEDGIAWPGIQEELFGNTAENVWIEKMTDSYPSNGMYYVLGESVVYRIRVWIQDGYIAQNMKVYDPIYMEDSEGCLGSLDNAMTNSSLVWEVIHVVTEEDVQRGYVENQAWTVWDDPATGIQMEAKSEVVTVPTGVAEPQTEEGELKLTKREYSTPANGLFYVPGEIITFELTLTNPSNVTYADVELHDWLFDDSKFMTYPIVEAGFEDTVEVYYVVSEMDAIAGYVSNIAYAEGTIADRAERAVFYAPVVTVAAGADAPFGVITALDIVKEEVSRPLNGQYYTKGETITYQITYTNIGETRLEEIKIYDTLQSEKDGHLVSTEFLDSEDGRVCYYQHVVTAADVAKGYVANMALAEYQVAEGYRQMVQSNIVVSETDGEPTTTYTPDSGSIDVEQLPSQGANYCTCALQAWDGTDAKYETTFCPKHTSTQEAVLMMMKNARNDNERRMIWGYAFALWQSDLDAIYEDLLAAADDAAKITLMSERVRFLTLSGNYRFTLSTVMPQKAVYIEETIAKLWQDKVIGMCYELSTASNPLVESLLRVEPVGSSNQSVLHCTCEVTEQKGNKLSHTEKYCISHGFTARMTAALMSDEMTDETWKQVRTLWDLELKNCYDTLYKNAGSGAGITYLAEYSAFVNWLEAREALLNMLYANHPEIVAEVMVNTIMEHTLDICERMN